MARLDGKVAMITGATGGIGAATAKSRVTVDGAQRGNCRTRAVPGRRRVFLLHRLGSHDGWRVSGGVV